MLGAITSPSHVVVVQPTSEKENLETYVVSLPDADKVVSLGDPLPVPYHKATQLEKRLNREIVSVESHEGLCVGESITSPPRSSCDVLKIPSHSTDRALMNYVLSSGFDKEVSAKSMVNKLATYLDASYDDHVLVDHLGGANHNHLPYQHSKDLTSIQLREDLYCGASTVVRDDSSHTSCAKVKIPFQKSIGLEKFTASSYDVDKVIPMHRSDFIHLKLVKQSPIPYGEALFIFPG